MAEPSYVGRKMKRGSNAGEKRENVIDDGSARGAYGLLPVDRAKSIAQVSFGRVAGRGSSRSLPFTRARRVAKPIAGLTRGMRRGLVLTMTPALTAQPNVNTPIAITRRASEISLIRCSREPVHADGTCSDR
jgi:hypothetical protein